MDFIFGVPDIILTPFGADGNSITWGDVQVYDKHPYDDYVEVTTASTHSEDFSLLRDDVFNVGLTYVTKNVDGNKGVYFESYIWTYERSKVQYADAESPVSVVHIFKVVK